MLIGSACSGYDGLALGLIEALGGGTVSWQAEVDPAANRILACRYPGTPNLGDITGVDWHQVPDVDWLIAGYPCQPFSDSGHRKGTDDERHLWPHLAHGIRILRPRFVLLENVRGHLGRGFINVLNGLAAFGYVGSWACVRASDVGAAHRRERLFILAADASRFRHRDSGSDFDAWLQACAVPGVDGPPAGSPPAADAVRNLTLFPSPRASDYTGACLHGDGGPDLRTVAVTLLPTPRASDGEKGSPNQHGSSGDLMLSSAVQAQRWGAYGEAISRWEQVTGRPAPPATQQWPGGQLVLSPTFVEWLMGLDDGFVTRAPRVTRNDALRVLGNGVVPLQAARAVRILLPRLAALLRLDSRCLAGL